MKTIRFYRLNFSCHDIPLLFRFLPIEGKRLSIGGRLDIPAIKQGYIMAPLSPGGCKPNGAG